MAKKFLTGLTLVNLDSDPLTGLEGELYFNTSASVAKIYRSGEWAEVGGGNSVTVSTTAPLNPQVGDTWYKNDSGSYYVWDGSYWVEINGTVGLTEEQVQDYAAPLLNHSNHSNITASYDDANNEIILSTSASVTSEQIQDSIAPLFTHSNHTNITATYDDGNNEILLVASPGYTDENAVDAVALALTSGSNSNVVITYNDALNTIDLNTSGSIVNIDSIVYPDYITFDTSPETSSVENGTIFWDSGDGLLKLNIDNGLELGIGQESVALVNNQTGVSIPKASVVYINGAQGQRPTVALADADAEGTSSKTFGFTAETIGIGADGFVVTEGILRGVNTNGMTEGGALWLSSTAGGYTQTMPTAPINSVFLGYVVKAHSTAGEIFVKVQNGYELNELHNVIINGIQNNQGLVYESSSSLWKNKDIVNSLTGTENEISISASVGNITLSLPENIHVDVTGDLTGNADTATTLETARTISLGGVLSGSVSFNGSSDVTITADMVADSVSLGTDTTGDYVASVSGSGDGISVTGTGEGASVTIQNTGVTSVSGTANEVTVSASVGSVTIGLPDSVNITNDLTVGGNLTVSGSTIYLNVENLLVEDNIVTLNSNVSGSSSVNAGIEVERGDLTNVQIRWNESNNVWEYTNDGITYQEIGSGAGTTVSETAPLDPQEGMTWYNTTDNILYVYDGTYWIEVTSIVENSLLFTVSTTAPAAPVTGMGWFNNTTSSFFIYDGTFWVEVATIIENTYPTQSGNAGKFLTTDGTDVSWADVDALPSQTGEAGKYLTTTGSAAYWAEVAGAVYQDTAPTGVPTGTIWVDSDASSAIINTNDFVLKSEAEAYVPHPFLLMGG